MLAHSSHSCTSYLCFRSNCFFNLFVFICPLVFGYTSLTASTYLCQELAGTIKLSAFSSFSLFECRKVVSSSKSSDPGNGMLSYGLLIIVFLSNTTLSIVSQPVCHLQRNT